MKFLVVLSCLMMSISVEAMTRKENLIIKKHMTGSIVKESLIRQDFQEFEKEWFKAYPVELEFDKDQLILRNNGDLYAVSHMIEIFESTHHRGKNARYFNGMVAANPSSIYVAHEDELFYRIDQAHLEPIGKCDDLYYLSGYCYQY